jgi:hypothetical protein
MIATPALERSNRLAVGDNLVAKGEELELLLLEAKISSWALHQQ